MLYRMKWPDEEIPTMPTISFNVETLGLPTSPKLEATLWDIGWCEKIRSVYRHYFENTNACVWVVDSTDRERIADARELCQSTMYEMASVNGDAYIPSLMYVFQYL